VASPTPEATARVARLPVRMRVAVLMVCALSVVRDRSDGDLGGAPGVPHNQENGKTIRQLWDKEESTGSV
jgi:hypothetical protein